MRSPAHEYVTIRAVTRAEFLLAQQKAVAAERNASVGPELLRQQEAELRFSTPSKTDRLDSSKGRTDRCPPPPTRRAPRPPSG